MVNWVPSTKTTLLELEVTSKDKVSPLSTSEADSVKSKTLPSSIDCASIKSKIGASLTGVTVTSKVVLSENSPSDTSAVIVNKPL